MLKQHKALYFIVAIIAAVAVGAFVLVNIYNFKTEEEISASSLELSKGEVSKDSIPDEVKGWQTYRNEEYGFEFRYPTEFNIKIQKDYLGIERWITLESTTYSPLTLQFVNGRSDYKTFEELAEEVSKLTCSADGPHSSVYCTDIIDSTAFVNSNGISGLELYLMEITEIFNPSEEQRTTTDKIRGPIYVFNIASQTNNQERGLFVNYYGFFTDKQLLDQILSTFRFVEPKK